MFVHSYDTIYIASSYKIIVLYLKLKSNNHGFLQQNPRIIQKTIFIVFNGFKHSLLPLSRHVENQRSLSKGPRSNTQRVGWNWGTIIYIASYYHDTQYHIIMNDIRIQNKDQETWFQRILTSIVQLRTQVMDQLTNQTRW